MGLKCILVGHVDGCEIKIEGWHGVLLVYDGGFITLVISTTNTNVVANSKEFKGAAPLQFDHGEGIKQS